MRLMAHFAWYDPISFVCMQLETKEALHAGSTAITALKEGKEEA